MGRHLRPRTRPNQSRRSALDTTVYNPITSNLVQYCVTASYRKRECCATSWGAVPQHGELDNPVGMDRCIMGPGRCRSPASLR